MRQAAARTRSTTSRPARRPPKGEGRQSIIDAAISCFAELGISETRWGDIAQRAGVNQPLINYHFPTLDSLYAEVANRVIENLRDEVVRGIASGGETPEGKLEGYIRAHFAWVRKERGLAAIWIHFYYLAAHKERFASLSEVIRTVGRERIASLVYEGVERGTFKLRKGAKVKELAVDIQGLITGNAVVAATERPASVREYADHTVRAVMSWLEP